MDLARDTERDTAPDATTLLRFRRLLEAHHLTRAIFEAINRHLADKALLMRKGTVVDGGSDLGCAKEDHPDCGQSESAQGQPCEGMASGQERSDRVGLLAALRPGV
jgi:IS5 family transposase